MENLEGLEQLPLPSRAALALPLLLCPPAAGGQGPGGRYNHGNWDYPRKLLPLLQRQGQNKQKLSIFFSFFLSNKMQERVVDWLIAQLDGFLLNCLPDPWK